MEFAAGGCSGICNPACARAAPARNPRNGRRSSPAAPRHHIGEAFAAEHGLEAQDVLVGSDVHHLRDNAFIAMAAAPMAGHHIYFAP